LPETAMLQNPISIEDIESCLPEQLSSDASLGAGTAPLHAAELFILASINRSVTAPDIAAAAGVSRRYIHRLFRKKYAVTPMQFLQNLRIAVANQIILQGKATSVRHIAAWLQFSNPGQFSKLYCKIYHHPPSADINRQRDSADQGQ
jgi:transcriptional regulator GlxA family with amidase domain